MMSSERSKSDTRRCTLAASCKDRRLVDSTRAASAADRRRPLDRRLDGREGRLLTHSSASLSDSDHPLGAVREKEGCSPALEALELGGLDAGVPALFRAAGEESGQGAGAFEGDDILRSSPYDAARARPKGDEVLVCFKKIDGESRGCPAPALRDAELLIKTYFQSIHFLCNILQ
jgi:hypothetical protein